MLGCGPSAENYAMHIPTATFLLLILALFGGSRFVTNRRLKVIFGALGVGVLVMGTAGFLG
jgi:hypothetical protein